MLLFGFLLFPMILATERELNISNYVVKIEEDTLKSITATNRSADALILSNLKLRHINKNAFDDVGNIKTLSISNNKLLHIPEYAFVNLTKLEHLDLSNNQISEFRNVFVGLNNLKFVNVSNNFMRYFTRGFFFGLTNFSEIIVEKYTLNFINSGMFENPFLKSISSTTLNEEQPNDDERYLQRLIENLRVKICIQEGKVKSLEAIKTDEVLTSDCSEVLVVDRSRTLLLDIRHITEFERGWYRLQDFPIDSIDLSNNEIVQITSEMLNDLPAGLKKVSLWGNYITRLEKGIIENVRLSTLDLGYNNIREIEDGALEKMNLTGSLYLNSNLLKDTKSKPNILKMLSFGFLLLPMVVAFKQELNINNYVVKIEDNTLKSFTAIGKSTNELDFANLNLQYINKHAFDHLNNVTTLNLSKNSLHRIFWLSSFGFLLFPMAVATQRELNINNYIIKMADDTMKSITATGKSTNELDLSKLYLRYINEHVFDHLSNIKILNLSRNFLHQFPEHTFVNLTNLDHLDLANNRIWSLKNVFVGLNNLKSVNVSNNNLMDLERGSFFGLSNSTKIFIDRYKVMTVSTEMFDDTSFDSDISEISRGEQSNYGEKVLQPLDKDLRVKVCIQNNIVKSLEVRMKDEILTADCRAVMIDHSANKLFLSTNGITGFERGWYRLHDFPFNEIDLNDNKIVQVTSEMLNDLSAGIKKVTLRGNMIRRLDKGIIENEYIRTLDLGYNFIREIEDGALEKMNLTGSLYLDYNELENTKFVATLPPNLKELNLKRNIITEITASFFSKLSKMRTVQVARNPIEMIQGGMFDNA